MSVSNINNTAAGQRATIKPNGITFGIELEFGAFIPKEIYPEDDDDNVELNRPEQYVRDCLTQTKVKLACNKPGCQNGEHEWRLPVTSEYIHSYNAWIVDRDCSITLDPNTELLMATPGSTSGNMELISRVLNFDRPTPCPFKQTYPCTGEVLEWEWHNELRLVLEVLQRAFDRPGYRVFVNRSTGLHIHIGHSNLGLPVPVVQGMAGAFTALERCFDNILPTSRINGDFKQSDLEDNEPFPGLNTTGFSYKYNGSYTCEDFVSWSRQASSKVMFDRVRKCIDAKYRGDDADQQSWDFVPCQQGWSIDRSADHVTPLTAAAAESIHEELLGFNVPAWLTMIQSRTTIDQLRALGFVKSAVLNLANLEEPQHNNPAPKLKNKNTAEIRMHAGSLDYNEISAWIDLTASLVRWCEVTPLDRGFSFLTDAWKNPKFTIVDPARELGARDTTINHYDSVLSEDSSEEYAKRRFEALTSNGSHPEDILTELVYLIALRSFQP